MIKPKIASLHVSGEAAAFYEMCRITRRCVFRMFGVISSFLQIHQVLQSFHCALAKEQIQNLRVQTKAAAIQKKSKRRTTRSLEPWPLAEQGTPWTRQRPAASFGRRKNGIVG